MRVQLRSRRAAAAGVAVGLVVGLGVAVAVRVADAEPDPAAEPGPAPGVAAGEAVEVRAQQALPLAGEPWGQLLPGPLPPDDQPPASSDCDSLWAWGRQRDGIGLRTYVRVEFRARIATQLQVTAVRANVVERRPTTREVVLYCTPRDWTPDSQGASTVTTLQLDHEAPATRPPGDIGLFPLDLPAGGRYEMFLDAYSFHDTIVWELELEAVVGTTEKRFVLRDGEQPFSTPEQPHGAGYVPPGYQWCWEPDPHLGPVPETYEAAEACL